MNTLKLKKTRTMKTQINIPIYIGYKIPKSMDYSKIEIRESFKIPKVLNTKDFYYIFYNETSNVFIIPQKIVTTGYKLSDKERVEIDQFFNYLKKPISKKELFNELIPSIKEYTQLECINRDIKDKELERRLKEKGKRNYERTEEKLGRKFKIRQLHKNLKH